jgi:hypothetical protein
MSVYATLMCEIGRSSDDRAVNAEEKNDCVFARWNISTPGVMGVMACCEDFSIALVIVYDVQTYHDHGTGVRKHSIVGNMVVQVF